MGRVYCKYLALFVLLTQMCSCDGNKPGDTVPPVDTPPEESKVPSDSDPVSVRAKFMYDSFGDAFFVTEGSRQFYREKLMDGSYAYFWHQALMILMTEDVWDYTGDIKVKTRINYLLQSFIEHNGPDWSWNEYNDDLAWAGLAFIRGYRINPNDIFLEKAIHAYELLYNRGWDEQLGGGIWWSIKKGDKSGLSNNPSASIACHLYQVTGDLKYLNQARAIYGWVRNNLFDEASGAVYENMQANGYVGKDNADNVYNSGAFIEAATLLYRITKQQNYYDDAVMAIDYIIENKTVNGIMSRANIHEGGWQSEFARGMGMFVKDHNLWQKTTLSSGIQYYGWMKMNADAAWKARRKDLHLTWNEWVTETANTDLYSLECNSAVVMLHVVPDALPQ